MSTPPSYLVVGAGFAGAVHARLLAESGGRVTVIDRRDHIAGNAFDSVDENGVRRHHYGPHLFHTNNERVFRWLEQFGEWTPYEHRVEARLSDGRLVPLPVNRRTVSEVFGVSLPDAEAVQAFLARIAVPHEAPRNAAEYLASRIGRELTDLFFRPYTKKMWQLDLEEMDASVVKRIPLRFDDEDRYFPNDRFQALPRHGYTAIVAAILDHPGIAVHTSTPYAPGMEREFTHCFNSMAIDEWFGFELGELPYRSIRFHSETRPREAAGPRTSVINYTHSEPVTRETHWHILPEHLVRDLGRVTVTIEEPCDYRDNAMERYYPVKTADGRYQAKYEQYRALAERLPNMTFIGRCGTYQYLDMDQVINQSLAGVTRFLRGA